MKVGGPTLDMNNRGKLDVEDHLILSIITPYAESYVHFEPSAGPERTKQRDLGAPEGLRLGRLLCFTHKTRGGRSC